MDGTGAIQSWYSVIWKLESSRNTRFLYSHSSRDARLYSKEQRPHSSGPPGSHILLPVCCNSLNVSGDFCNCLIACGIHSEKPHRRVKLCFSRWLCSSRHNEGGKGSYLWIRKAALSEQDLFCSRGVERLKWGPVFPGHQNPHGRLVPEKLLECFWNSRNMFKVAVRLHRNDLEGPAPPAVEVLVCPENHIITIPPTSLCIPLQLVLLGMGPDWWVKLRRCSFPACFATSPTTQS